MSNSWLVRIVGVVILVIGIAAIGYVAYTTGVAQGQTVAPVTAEVAETDTWQAAWGMHPFRGLAFLPVMFCLAPFLLCLFIFLPLRMIFGAPRMMFGPPWMHMRMHGRWHDCEGEVPSPFEEWHKHMHEDKKKEE
jgi:hypothetical protein